jgi:hypothetical protein
MQAPGEHYVSALGSNEYPYDTWEKAAHSIQDAVDAETPTGVFVAPGRYIGNVVVPEGTSVYGAGAASCTIRGVPPGHEYWSSVVFVDAGALLSGFTVEAEGCWDGVICYGGEVRDCVVIGARSIAVCANDGLIQACTVLGNNSGIHVRGVTVVYDTVVSGSLTGVGGAGDEGYSVLLHCTISGNRTGVTNADTMPLAVRDSIVWGNSDGDIRWFSLPDVVGCVTSDERLVGINGNISAEPLFVGWGDFNDSDNPIYVGCSNAGEQDGTQDKPFPTIGAALRTYDFHLAIGSPCVGAASDGLNIGAFPHDVPARERSASVLINVAPGTYNEGELMLRDGVHLKADPSGAATIAPPQYKDAAWMEGASSIQGFSLPVNLGDAVICAPRSAPLISRCRIFPYALGEYSAAVTAYGRGGRPSLAGCVVEGFDTAIACSAIIESCTLMENTTAVLGAQDGEPPEIRNSVIWSLEPDGLSALLNVPASNISHCLVSDPSLDGINGNVFGDPQFVGARNGDFRLLPDSPCIDAGFNDPELPETDIAGMHRIMFGGKSLTVDMGAYEYYINELTAGPGAEEATLTWSSLGDRSYSILYSDDLLSWLLADGSVRSAGNMTTSRIDDGSQTGVPPSLAPRRFYRILENP